MALERRPVLRRHLSPPAGSFHSEKIFGLGRIRNLTKSGLFLQSATVPEVGKPVRVLFGDARGSKIEVRGRVVWTTEQLPRDHKAKQTRGFGMKLDRPTPDFLEFFEYVMTH